MHKLYEQFDLFNDLIFDGEIPPCEIVLKKNLEGEAMGLFYPLVDEYGNKLYLIELSKDYDNLAITLIHEMVHALQYKLDKKVNHKKYFKQWRDFIRYEFGLDI